jgi:diguanylate cyclase (GGDEF)-like protein/PAS domain S-box-containing protein
MAGLLEPATVLDASKQPAEAMLQAFAEALPNLLLVFDPRGHLLRWNSLLSRLAGYTPAQVQRLRYHDLFPGHRESTRWTELWLGSAPRQFTATLICQSGRELPLLVGAARLRLDQRELLVLSASDLSQQRQLERHLERLAYFDPLTRLPNRTGFTRELATRHPGGRIAGGRQALVVFDIDRFRAINDAFGHELGDEVLKALARRLRTLAGPDWLLGHLGEDEFGLVWSDLDDLDAALVRAHGLLEGLQAPIEVRGERIVLGCTVGVAQIDTAADAQQWLRQADTALYRAKELGRAQVLGYVAQMGDQSEQRWRTECELRQALVQGELCLYLQPIFHLRGQAVQGYEALCRWQHPQRGLLLPGSFMAAAEAAGLSVDLDLHMLRATVGFLEAHPWSGYCNVNVSAASLVSTRWLGAALDVVIRNPLLRGRLQLEITETALLGDQRLVQEHLRQLHEAGIRILLDDFGTGYSSLAHLQRFPISGIKIDRSFIDRIDHSPRDQQIVRALVGLAEELELSVTAEGIETERQQQTLVEIGCQSGQGYLLARPAPVELALIHGAGGPASSLRTDLP